MIRAKKRLNSLPRPIAIVLCATTLLVATLLSVETHAKQPKNTLAFAGIGWTAGGDTFDTAETRQNVSSGILNLDNELSAGGDIHVWFGTIWIHSRHMETFFAVGYHNDTHTFQFQDDILNTSSSGSSNFGQITYDIIPTYRVSNFRFGTGISYHTNIRHSETITKTITATGDTETDPTKIQYEDALGTVVSLGYDFSLHGRIDLRYQFIEYVTKDQSILLNQKLNGDSVGLYIYVTF